MTSEDGKIALDATPHVWLHHMELRFGAGGDDPLAGGVHLVQVLSMGEDGIWARFLEVENMTGWKVYVPRDRILSMVLKDEAWPDE